MDFFNVITKILKKTKNRNEVPVAAIIIDSNNKVVSKSVNSRENKKIICGHAEINAINRLYKKTKHKNLSEFKLITSMEPCLMCIGAIEQTNIKEVYFYIYNKKYGATKQTDKIKFIKIDNLDHEIYFKNLMKEFFKKKR